MEENFEIDENIDDEIIDNEGFIILIEEEHIIIDEYDGKIINLGKNAGIEKNKYWNVLNIETNEEYYIMNCGNKIIKIDLESIDKIKKYKYTWYLLPCGYCVSTFKKTKIYMHAFLMNRLGGENDGLSVDHINQNKFDNRLLNLRLVTQSVQNENKPYKKKKESKYNKNRPPGMENIILPRNMEYRLENEKNKLKNGKVTYRIKEYFNYNHKKPIFNGKKILKSSRSTEKSALEKYNELMQELKNYDIKIVYG
jgi:hypothetical protein